MEHVAVVLAAVVVEPKHLDLVWQTFSVHYIWAKETLLVVFVAEEEGVAMRQYHLHRRLPKWPTQADYDG